MCNPTYLPPFAFLFWVPIIVFETFLFSLALRMAYHNFQEIGSWRGISLVHIILRDNFIFFVMYVYCLSSNPVFMLTFSRSAFASYIITAVTWLSANPRYFTLPGSFTCAFTTIMGCRLILNLCRVYYHPTDVAASVRPQSIWAASEGIKFKPPALVADTTTHGNWETEREQSPEPKSRADGAYELYDLAPLDKMKVEDVEEQ